MIFDFSNYDQLIPLVTNSLIVGALLAVVGGLVGVFVINRDMSFAVHGISELSFAGASITLLLGGNVVFGWANGCRLLAGRTAGIAGLRRRRFIR
ncbi:MAG: hypothetical protein RL545_233 [Actinomycetota bacterium]